MTTIKPINYQHASKRVKSIFEDIENTRNSKINNFWKYLANNPSLLDYIWSEIRRIMPSGELSSLEKEIVYITVSVINNCQYCIHSHTFSAKNKGLTKKMFNELLHVIVLSSKSSLIINDNIDISSLPNLYQDNANVLNEVSPFMKELVFASVAIINRDGSSTRKLISKARKKGLMKTMEKEFFEVIKLASQTNVIANNYQIPVDKEFNFSF